MSKSTSKAKEPPGARLLGKADGGAGGDADRPRQRPWGRLLAQVRDALFAPLQPFPLAQAAGSGHHAGLSCAPSPDTVFLREWIQEPAPVSAPALQHAHTLMSQVPAWLPMPETRRNSQGQIVLNWQGDQSRQFSIVVGADGMLIYSARLGSRGRFDGAEPIGRQLSPIVLHAIDQLRDKTALPR